MSSDWDGSGYRPKGAKARTTNALWRAFRPGSVGQKIIRAVVYAVIILALALAASIIL